MFKPLLFTTALAAVLSAAVQPLALADERSAAHPGPHIVYPGSPHVAGRHGFGQRFGAMGDRPLTERFGEPPLRVPGWHHRQHRDVNAGYVGAYDFDGNDIGHDTERADGEGFAPLPGDNGYGIPPAGGLAVYSPGAYGPGPRIISLRHRHRYGFGYGGSLHRRAYGHGYGIPPAGGLAVYSPGAYGPGPRVISLRHPRTHMSRAGYGYGYGYDAGFASDGIPTAGGLAVYSPGAYGPGPRIVTLSSGWGTTSQQWGCGCGGHAGY